MPLPLSLLALALMIPAAVAGIASGLGLLIRDWRELSGPLADLLEATRPLWPLGQGVFSIVAGSGLLLLAATLIAHALKSRV